MAESPPLEVGALSESRELLGEMEAMKVDASVLAYSLLSGGEEGEVHLSDELIPESALQALFSANAAVEGVGGGDEQAPREALTLHPGYPLEGVAGRDVQALEDLAIRTGHAVSSSRTSQVGGVVPGNQPVADNYLRIHGVGQVLLDASVELRSEDLPQSREDVAYKQPTSYWPSARL